MDTSWNQNQIGGNGEQDVNQKWVFEEQRTVSEIWRTST